MASTISRRDAFNKLIATGRKLSREDVKKLRDLADVPIHVYRDAWLVANPRWYRDRVVEWRNTLGWTSDASNAAILACVALGQLDKKTHNALMSNWESVAGVEPVIEETPTINGGNLLPRL